MRENLNLRKEFSKDLKIQGAEQGRILPRLNLHFVESCNDCCSSVSQSISATNYLQHIFRESRITTCSLNEIHIFMYFTEMHHSQCVAVGCFDGFTQFHSWYFLLQLPYCSILTAVVISLTPHLENCLRFFFSFWEKKSPLEKI